MDVSPLCYGLFGSGVGPTTARAMTLNMGMLASNDQAKETLANLGFQKGGMPQVVGASSCPPVGRKCAPRSCRATPCNR
eukprot:908103-Prorocentrum_minimum.AAC.1